jgi:hypothetical protein
MTNCIKLCISGLRSSGAGSGAPLSSLIRMTNDDFISAATLRPCRPDPPWLRQLPGGLTADGGGGGCWYGMAGAWPPRPVLGYGLQQRVRRGGGRPGLVWRA